MPELERSLVWWAYPYAGIWTKENDEGKKEKFVQVRSSVQVDKAGFFSIGSFVIRSGGLYRCYSSGGSNRVRE